MTQLSFDGFSVPKKIAMVSQLEVIKIDAPLDSFNVEFNLKKEWIFK